MNKWLEKGAFVLLSMIIVLGAVVAAGQEDAQNQIPSTLPKTPTLTITEIGEKDDIGRAVVVLSDGTVVAAGSTDNGKDDDFALLKYSSNVTGNSNDSKGVTTKYYLIATTSISDITRNSAMTGGRIILKGGASSPKISKRGVCYSITPYPVYKEETSTSSESTATTSTTVSDTTSTTSSTTSILPSHTSQTSYNYDTVRSGCTSDGSGVGTFGSDISKITPGTTYYVRAYALLENSGTTTTKTTITDPDGEVTEKESTTTSSASDNGTIIYGNQLSFITEDACFIATAAYGSIFDQHVVILRQFRDTFLKTNALGLGLVKLYYQYSLGLAETIKKHKVLRFIVRVLLVPLVLISYFFLHTGLKVKLMISILLLSSVILTVYYRYKKIKVSENKYVTE